VTASAKSNIDLNIGNGEYFSIREFELGNFIRYLKRFNFFQCHFISSFPFISSCDFKKWDSPIVESYYVFGTPTMFLLDNKREILLRPNSVLQMDAWVDWFLIKGNR